MAGDLRWDGTILINEHEGMKELYDEAILSQTLEELEGEEWGLIDDTSYLISESHRLRHVPLGEFTNENLRVMLVGEVGLRYLVPIALERIGADTLASTDFGPGDLLRTVLHLPSEFWESFPHLIYPLSNIMIEVEDYSETVIEEMLPRWHTFRAIRTGCGLISQRPDDAPFFDIDRTIEVLERTPATLCSLLGGLSDEWVTSNYGPDTFSPFDVVGHLIHGERVDWMERMRRILEHGTSLPFDSFDRFAMYEESKGKSMGELLETFATVRRDNLYRLRALNLSDEDLDRQGTHPSFGTVTLRQLLATWAVHDLNHLHQIAKSMAYQYRDEVGPWRAYLPLLPES